MNNFQTWKASGRIGRIKLNDLPGYERMSDIYYLLNGVLYGQSGRRVKGSWSRSPKYPYRVATLALKEGGRIHKRICRIIATAYVDGRTPDHNEVDHIDGNKQNDAPSNLEWVSRAENMRRIRADKKQISFNL